MTRLQFFLSIPTLMLGKVWPIKASNIDEIKGIIDKAKTNNEYRYKLLSEIVLTQYEYDYGRDKNGILNQCNDKGLKSLLVAHRVLEGGETEQILYKYLVASDTRKHDIG